jgi:hypothetical protein
MFDTSFLLDVLSSGIACICAGFLAYGGWLSVRGGPSARTRDTQQAHASGEADQPRMPSQSTNPLSRVRS